MEKINFKNAIGNLDITVLYCGDVHFSEYGLLKNLSQSIAQLVVASDDVAGLDLFKKHRPQLVVLHIDMQAIDGIAMCQAIRSIDPDVSIIFIAENETIEYLRAAIDLSVTKFFTRPVDGGLLSACAARVVADLEQKQRLLAKLEIIKQIEQCDTNRSGLSKIIDTHIDDFKQYPVLLIEKNTQISDAIKQSLGRRVGQIYTRDQ
ncbi:MAG: response regulator [Gammaproteobacteria bacterium]|nr:response regulator [Gammaproteobacteria bacterium]